MRQLRAKQLRKKVFGDYSIRDVRYARDFKTGQIRCIGHRAIYQKEKRNRNETAEKTQESKG